MRASTVAADNMANVSAPHLVPEKQSMSMFKRAATRASANQDANKQIGEKRTRNVERCHSTEFKKERAAPFKGASRLIQEDNYLTKSRVSAHGSQGRCSSVGSIDEVARPVYMKK